MEQMADRGTNGTIRDILYYNPGLLGTAATMQKDYYFRDTEVASFRSDWDDSNSIFLGVHAGKTNVYHGHMDAGSFVLDGFGTRYASDLGADNYNIRDSVWNLYRYRAEGHNTLVINPSKDGGQRLAGAARIDTSECPCASMKPGESESPSARISRKPVRCSFPAGATAATRLSVTATSAG